MDDFSDDVLDSSPLGCPDKKELVRLSNSAALGAILAYPYHLLTRVHFGERYVSSDVLFSLLGFWVKLAFRFHVVLILVLIYCWYKGYLQNGAWKEAAIAAAIYAGATLIAFVVQSVIIECRKSDDKIIASRCRGTPILWMVLFRHLCKRETYTSCIEPWILIGIGVCIIKSNWHNLMNVQVIAWSFFFLSSAWGTFILEAYTDKKLKNQELDILDDMKRNRVQQELIEQLAQKESAGNRASQHVQNSKPKQIKIKQNKSTDRLSKAEQIRKKLSESEDVEQ